MVKNLDLLDADELINNLYSKFKNDEEILKKHIYMRPKDI